jgi:hypothetical protein
MVCRKSYGDAAIALLVITFIFISNMLTGYGIIRYIFKLEDDEYVNRNHLILSGNMLSILSLAGSSFMLFSAGVDPMMTFAIFSAMLVLLIINIYLSNYDPTDPGSAWTVIVALGLDVYVKLSAVLIGYGVCSVAEVPAALYGMGRKLVK